jgi:MATE family multidrug resistance protein
VTTGRVFAIAVPAMLANLTTPLLGIVATAAIGRLGDAPLLGGVAMAAVIFDCLFWLFAFLRMGTVAFTAQALGAGERGEVRAMLARGLMIAGAIGVALVLLQVPLGSLAFAAMGGSEAVTHAAQTYFAIRMWSAPLALANYVVLGWMIGQARAGLALVVQIVINVTNMTATLTLVLGVGMGVAGAAAAALIAEAVGLAVGLVIARRLLDGSLSVPRAMLFDRAKLVRMMAVNRDIMLRTAALVGVFLFFTARGARAGDVTLAANAVLGNFILIGSFFLDGLANAAEQLCGRSVGARDRAGFANAARLVLGWGFASAVAATAAFVLFGTILIDLTTTSADVRLVAREVMWLASLTPVCGVLAYAYDGVYIGATWARDMRNLMVAAFLIFFGAWAALLPLGNAGLWGALLIFLIARGVLQAGRYPALMRASFA